MKTGVLFVCLGNICRSPLARFIFDDLAASRGVAHRFDVDSCGTGAWHAGEGADPRTIAVARLHGLSPTHTARQLDPAIDFRRFHLLLAMDLSNRANLLAAGAPPASVRLLRSFDPALATAPESHLSVPDPYYGGPDGFEHMYRMIHAACVGLLDHLAPGP
jgi:protein-tyrosine phosphatase